MIGKRRLLVGFCSRLLRGIFNIYVKPQRKSLPHELSQALFRSSVGFFPPKFRRIITSGKPAHHKQIKSRDDWIIFSETIRSRREGGIEHDVADLEIRKLVDKDGFGIRWNSASWFTAVKMCQAVGLFVVSLEFHRRGLAKFGLEVGRLRGIRKSLGLAQLAIQSGDSNLAVKCQTELSSNPLTPFAKSAKSVVNYLGVWIDGETGGNLGVVDSSETLLSSHIKGKSIHLIGPAVLREANRWKKPHSLIVRFMRPTGPVQVSGGDFDSGVPSLAYANGNTADFLSRLDEAAIRHLFAAFSVVVFKGHVPAVVRSNSDRPIRTIRADNELLLIYGRPNMAQVAIVDILGFAPSRLYVSGIDFFVGKYREDERWFDHLRSKQVDILNSGGKPFEVCGSISSHGAIENRNLLRNLLTNNRLDGDASFRESLLLTDEEYLHALEISLGRNCI